jgi:hypothetical protein
VAIAREVLAQAQSLGPDLGAVSAGLVQEGLAACENAYVMRLAAVADKQARTGKDQTAWRASALKPPRVGG